MSIMKRERTILTICILLVVVTATALVRNHRLQQSKQDLQDKLKKLQHTALSPVSIPAESVESRALPLTPTNATAMVVSSKMFVEDKKVPESYRSEIQKLQLQLTERDLRITELAEQVKNFEEEVESRARRQRLRQEEMAKLKEEDPERYKEIQDRRAEFRERLRTHAGDQYTFLEAVDISKWPVEWQENHVELLATVAMINEAINNAEEGGSDERNTRREMFTQLRESREMFAAEQDMLLYDAAQQMGFDEDGSWEFVDYIQTINNVASPRGLFRSRGR